MKRAQNGAWAHLQCARYFKEVKLADPDMIVGVENVSPLMFKIDCTICQKKRGACVTCDHKGCTETFHPSCALAVEGAKRGYALSYREGKRSTLCLNHAKL